MFCFVICSLLTTLKLLNVLKSKICLKMIEAMTPKTTDRTFGFSMNGYDSIYTVDCRVTDEALLAETT